jgi:hypothetical protein
MDDFPFISGKHLKRNGLVHGVPATSIKASRSALIKKWDTVSALDVCLLTDGPEASVAWTASKGITQRTKYVFIIYITNSAYQTLQDSPRIFGGLLGAEIFDKSSSSSYSSSFSKK